MTFDKNQTVFPSQRHREVWWWAIGLVPLEESLTAEVLEKSSPRVVEGCRQWRACFEAWYTDLYEHLDAYPPASSRQYRDLLEKIVTGGELREGAVVWPLEQWRAFVEKTDVGKAFRSAGLRTEDCLDALSRIGLRTTQTGGTVCIDSPIYPRMLGAMRVMERSPRMRETPARGHFAHCEFRQLYKSYSPGYNELLRKASDDSLRLAGQLHDFMRACKLTRYIHFGIIKYKYKGIRILDYALHMEDTPTLRVQMGTCAGYRETDDLYFSMLERSKPETRRLFDRSLVQDDCGHDRACIPILGREETVCQNIRLRINPGLGDLSALMELVAARKASIDAYRARFPE